MLSRLSLPPDANLVPSGDQRRPQTSCYFITRCNTFPLRIGVGESKEQQGHTCEWPCHVARGEDAERRSWQRMAESRLPELRMLREEGFHEAEQMRAEWPPKLRILWPLATSHTCSSALVVPTLSCCPSAEKLTDAMASCGSSVLTSWVMLPVVAFQR